MMKLETTILGHRVEVFINDFSGEVLLSCEDVQVYNDFCRAEPQMYKSPHALERALIDMDRRTAEQSVGWVETVSGIEEVKIIGFVVDGPSYGDTRVMYRNGRIEIRSGRLIYTDKEKAERAAAEASELRRRADALFDALPRLRPTEKAEKGDGK